MAIGAITFTADVQGRSVVLSALADNMTIIRKVERLTGSQVAGQGVIVRGSEDAPADGGLWRGTDWESPQATALTYIVTGEDENDSSTETATQTPTETVDYGGDFLMPIGRPELGINVIVELGGAGQQTYGVTQDVIPVLNRPDPVVVTWGRKMWTGAMTFLTLEQADQDNLLNVLQFPSLMFVTYPDFGFAEPVFLAPGQVTVSRTTGTGFESSRRFNVALIEVQRPPTTYAADLPNVPWQDRLDALTDWQSVLDDFPMWYDFAGFRVS